MSRNETKTQPRKQTALAPQLLTLETVKLQLLQEELKHQRQQQTTMADQVAGRLGCIG
ncbi:hypothetical protein N0K08_08210 [Acidovorax sp. Be4]|uniref:Uncharacterized protein n=1 Tax=Acidovorax bellezanensis TaxID=2976702 RepID=A0ABT2PJF8_9BURK|nr:hypothetical protein [Acidovorax sp. Be4]MCT9810613.1 hypothetical protein [Acidovorax sp. Be4]